MTFLSREQLVNELLPKGGVGIEIGVFSGEFTRKLVDLTQPRQLVCIDLWDNTWLRYFRRTKCGWEEAGGRAADALREFEQSLAPELTSGVVIPLKGRSPQVLELLRDRTFSWAYLDGQHDYKTLSAELSAMKRLIQPGGWILGHDYCDVLPEVRHAVDHFVSTHRLELILTDQPREPVWRPVPTNESVAYNSFAIHWPGPGRVFRKSATHFGS